MKKSLSLIIFTFFFVLMANFLHGQSAEARRYFLTPQPVAADGKPAPAPAPAPVVKEAETEIPFEPEFALSAEWASRHVRDGWTRNDRPVGIAQFEFSEQMCYLGAVGIYDFCDPLGRKYRFEESRFYAGISLPVSIGEERPPMMLDLNWSWLHYPDRSGELNSAEISLSLYSDRIYGGENWSLGYGVSLIHDYELEETSIVQALYYARKLDETGKLDLDLRGEIYWGDTAKMQGLTEKSCDGNGFHAAVLTGAVNWAFHPSWLLTPYISCSIMTDGRAREAARADAMNSNCTLWGGIRLSTCF